MTKTDNTNTTHLPSHRVPARSVLAAAALGVLALGGCGSSGGENTASPSASESSAASSEQTTGGASGSRGQTVTVEQQWMKAVDSGMTGVFGTISNDGDTAVTLTGASAEGISGFAELHETVADQQTGSTVMQKMTEPLVIEPGESVVLEPGADHIMLMDLTCAPKAGQTLPIELSFEGGGTQTVEVPVRDYQGAQEQYAHEGGQSTGASDGASHGMPGMDHGEALPACEEPS